MTLPKNHLRGGAVVLKKEPAVFAAGFARGAAALSQRLALIPQRLRRFLHVQLFQVFSVKTSGKCRGAPRPRPHAFVFLPVPKLPMESRASPSVARECSPLHVPRLLLQSIPPRQSFAFRSPFPPLINRNVVNQVLKLGLASK